MKHKKPKPSAPPPPRDPDFTHNPFAAALADKRQAAKPPAKPPAKQAAPSRSPAPAPPAPPAPPPARVEPRPAAAASPPTPKPLTLPKLPDRPLSAAELFAFAVDQLPQDLRPYDLKFGSGREAPRLPQIDDEAEKKAQAKAQAAAAPAHLSPAQREALREATRVRELQAAFEQEMQDTGVRRAKPSKRIDLQTPTLPSVADLLAQAQPLQPARPSLSRGALTAPDLLDQLNDPNDPDNALAIPPNFTHTQRRLLERAQRRDGSVPEVSLRGMTLADAMPALQTFLAEQRACGARTVRVITGKGKQSEGAPVLKGAVESFLLSAGAHLITAFAPEITRDGDYGAFAVQLKR